MLSSRRFEQLGPDLPPETVAIPNHPSVGFLPKNHADGDK